MLVDVRRRFLQRWLDDAAPDDPDRALHCRFLASQSISLVGPAAAWHSRTLRVPEVLGSLEL